MFLKSHYDILYTKYNNIRKFPLIYIIHILIITIGLGF